MSVIADRAFLLVLLSIAIAALWPMRHDICAVSHVAFLDDDGLDNVPLPAGWTPSMCGQHSRKSKPCRRPPVFDPVDVRVARILRLAAERAYDFPRPHDEGPCCETCGGDGCKACGFTGDPA